MGNDGRLVVNFAAMQAASGDITQAVGALRTQLGDLERDAARLVQTWEGEAQAAYHQRQKQWQRAAEGLSAALQHIQRALDNSAQDYMRTEQYNARQFPA